MIEPNQNLARNPKTPHSLTIIGFIAAFVVVLVSLVLWKKMQTAQQVVVGPTSQIEPGVSWHEFDLPGGDGSRKLWIYTPSIPPTGKLPCIFIAPAGSTCLTGNAFTPDDQPEHMPYVHAGFIVVAYSLDGNLAQNANDYQFQTAAAAFSAAHFGLDNEQAAVAYSLRTYPQIDTHRLYVAGHSSAGTMALLAAENDPRIAACVAYAPVGDLASRYSQSDIDKFSSVIPNCQDVLSEASPLTNASRLHCPVFIFHADDDDTVLTSNVSTFMNELHKTNDRIYYASVPTGGHYYSMRNQGIPEGIYWLTHGLK
jgi:dipeptidyl aminopeptidase/acylaminoacyl peptidase